MRSNAKLYVAVNAIARVRGRELIYDGETQDEFKL
jgi:hypothetical protein